jgi:hypothetical protein
MAAVLPTPRIAREHAETRLVDEAPEGAAQAIVVGGLVEEGLALRALGA